MAISIVACSCFACNVISMIFVSQEILSRKKLRKKLICQNVAITRKQNRIDYIEKNKEKIFWRNEEF